MYAIVVHSAAEEYQAPPPPPGRKSKEADGNVNSEGWVVTRRFRDFETLHIKLKEVITLSIILLLNIIFAHT